MRGKTLVLILLVSNVLCAQTAMDRYLEFKRAAQEDYSDFRDVANSHYASFLRAAWEYYAVTPAIPRPDDNPVPPVVYEPPVEEPEPVPIPYEDVKTEPDNTPEPEPVAPVLENNVPSITYSIDYYGTALSFRHPSDVKLKIGNFSGEGLANAWELLATGNFDNLLYDCLKVRQSRKLCDWAYLEVLQSLSNRIYGNTNESVLLQAFLYANSGYQMRLAATTERLFLLIGSRYVFYDRGYFTIDDTNFFPLEEIENGVSICNGGFEGEQPFSMQIPMEQVLAYSPTGTITRTASSNLRAQCKVNTNLINFYNHYPTGHYGDDFSTRWALYADTPLDKKLQESLYPQLMQAIRGVPEAQAVNILLNWVQTAFEYEYDDKVWGGDRAFFPAESIFYPYCDCEDRSILFSRIVRDLLNLDVVLLYYPGHLATAVKFHQNVKGDYLVINGDKYVVCDPTYIGAPIGATMPGMDNNSAKVIALKK